MLTFLKWGGYHDNCGGFHEKILVITIILVALLIPAFAEGQIGVTVAPEWRWTLSMERQKLPESMGTMDMIIAVDGTNYFGSNGGFGIEYGLGIGIPVYSWVGDMTTDDENGNNAFIFKAGIFYRHAFSSLLGLSAGLGFSGSYSSEDTAFYSTSTIFIDMYGKIAVDLTFFDALRLNAGLGLGGPVYNSYRTSSNGHTMTGDVNMSQLYLSPFVGISYVY